jgi:hypothetical protein
MEKNDMPIVGAFDIAAGASGAGTSAAGASAAAPVQDPVATSNVAAGASAAAPVQAPIVASDVAAGASAVGASAVVQFPIDWDPYEQEPYVALENPYDTSIADDEEVTLCSLAC